MGCNLGKALTLIAHAIVGERTAGPGGALTVRTSHRQNGKRFRFVIARRLSAFFILHFSVFRIPSFPCPAPTANSPARRKKSSDLSIGASCWRYLSSRAVTRKVLSAQMSLTSVFGMGTGVPSPQSTPTIYLSSGFCPRTFIIIPPLDSLVKRFFGDPSGIRTHVNGVRGRCLNHLTMGPWCTFTDSNRGPTD